jgi:hypothetical protein
MIKAPMNFEPDESELQNEQELVYGLLGEVEGLANGSKYSPGKVPTTLIFQTPNNGGERLTISVDKIREICGGDMERTLAACRNLSSAINAKAQMLVFEKEMKGELAPPPGSGIHPETVFAVGRAMNSPRERGFAVLRSRGELHLEICPEWRNHDDHDNKKFVYVLPDDAPTAKEQEIARASLREIGIEINRLHCQQQDHEEDNRQEQGRGFGMSF